MSTRTDEVFEKVLQEFYLVLVKKLPMNDAIFNAGLHSRNLFPSDLKDQIQSKSTRAEKASHFLDHFIIDLTKEKFDDFINVMENSEFERLKKLAKKIKTKLHKRPADSENGS